MVNTADGAGLRKEKREGPFLENNQARPSSLLAKGNP